MAPFKDRKQAGEFLGRRMKPYHHSKPVVLALPRGGIPVAAEVARALDAPLDILAVKKLGVPGYEELALGAVSEEGEPAINDDVLEMAVKSLSFTREELHQLVEQKRREIREQLELFRDSRPFVEVKGRVAIVVDDGLATGATMEAAVQVLRARKVKKVIVAVPVGAIETAARIAQSADEVICLVEPRNLQSVGMWYRDFTQVENDEALRLLRAGNIVSGAGHDPHFVRFQAGTTELEGDIEMPVGARALVIFAHGSGSSRRSPRNREVAKALHEKGLGTFLFDLLSPEEADTRKNVFDIPLLAARLEAATVFAHQRYPGMPIAYFGASTGAAAALVAAARAPEGLFAVVSRGGRVDLAGTDILQVKVPVLVLVGSEDHPVIASTMEVLDRFPVVRLEIVTGAGHLFEEPGAMSEVARLATEWITGHLPGRKSQAPREAGKGDAVAALERVASPLRGIGGLERLAARIAGKRVVMLGESTHGTQEFYEIRRELTQILLDRHGFRFVAVEGDWPDCQRLHEYVRSGSGGNARDVVLRFRRWPTWMWGNEEVVKLVSWMREHRDGRAFGFYGLDVYSLFESIEEVQKILATLDEGLSRRVAERYACFEPWRRDEITYARSLLEIPEGCRKQAAESLRDILNARLSTPLRPDLMFDAEQNARIVRNAEAYYRAMLEGDQSSWNVRDQHMMSTLALLLERQEGGGKAVVWAHNTHVGDYRHTEMIDEGYVNLGGLARERFGRDQVALVGFGSYMGQVTAGSAWAAPEEVIPLPPAHRGSAEELLHRVAEATGSARLVLSFDQECRESVLAQRIGQRAVGVVYGRAAEASGRNYVPTVLPERYDFFVFVDRTTALRSLHAESGAGMLPETWPVGW